MRRAWKSASQGPIAVTVPAASDPVITNPEITKKMSTPR